jgi:hypothetical protein
MNICLRWTKWLAGLLAMLSSLSASAIQLEEYQIKAAFLQNFSLFIYWAEDISPPTWNICVFGDNSFGNALQLVVDEFNKDASNPRKVIYLRRMEDTSQCHILYLDNSEQHRQTSLLDYLNGKPILTVSSIPGFVDKGGMIEFYRKNNRVQFYINLGQLRANHLKANANLLRVGTVVNVPESD